MIKDITNLLVIQEEAREWCKLPYPGHPYGCPNYGNSDECPPTVKRVEEVFNLSHPHYFATETFNLNAHALHLSRLHPDWTEKQCRCCLYWQGGVRKRLKQQCLNFINQQSLSYTFTLIPEAMGVNVFRTAAKIGLKLYRNPKTIVHKIALIGVKR
jgi:predicted metal-binding protein